MKASIGQASEHVGRLSQATVEGPVSKQGGWEPDSRWLVFRNAGQEKGSVITWDDRLLEGQQPDCRKAGLVSTQGDQELVANNQPGGKPAWRGSVSAQGSRRLEGQ
ncbi:hypothetical protein chiPu_0006818 [Chiloscyllium punctatum]|uniref:Uncharacterized protein n=1 Tax=Chiloscyllium punctatum TaxID=137246 RepID=A0A401SDC0_CHIPU|nr:hypothetical protein [Chiloscyllium punctatum]